MSETYDELKNGMTEYLSGSRTAADLKSILAPFGIYQQKNGRFMMRIRITGGNLSLEKFKKIICAAKITEAGYLHLSTRQTIQLHDVMPEHIYPAVLFCSETGLPFRGGGGNTFRNIMVHPMDGLTKSSVFEVMPYAEALKSMIFLWDRAFALPRKLKIGFYDSPTLIPQAMVQDLSFVARIRDNKHGFQVFGGGGLGRNSGIGIELADFIPADAIPNAARAMTDLFFDHGNRENRNRARIRFLLADMGEEAFRKLFLDYFHQTDLPKLCLENEIKETLFTPKKKLSVTDPEFSDWRNIAVVPSETESDIHTVRLFVPRGNLTISQAEKITSLCEKYAIHALRLTPEQDMLIPRIHQQTLSYLFQNLTTELSEIDLMLHSFSGHIVTCIGASVCKIGVLNSVDAGEAVARKLDTFFLKNPNLKSKYALMILDSIRISGCPSSCSAHPTAKIGLQGLMRNIDGKIQPVWQFFTKPPYHSDILGTPEPDVTPDSEMAEKIMTLLIPLCNSFESI